MDGHLLSRHVREYFSGCAGTPLEAPAELAREVVCGSVENARRPGFEPHDDFAAAAGHRAMDRPVCHHLRRQGQALLHPGPL